MPRLSISATLIIAAIGLLLLPASIASQGRRIGTLEVEDIDNRPAAAREVLVKLQSPDGAAAARLASGLDPEDVEPLGRSGIFRIRSRSFGAAALIAALSKRPDVVYAEPNFIVQTFAEPNDPLYPQLWGLKNIGQPVNGGAPGTPGADIRAVAGWDIALGTASTVVAVVDTGIDYMHTDLAGNMWSAPARFTVTIGGVAITCQAGTHGFNAITRACDPMDDHNHGTHVAGTIGAVGNNALGVTGVSWLASLMGLKFLDANGSGTIAQAVDAIDFAVQVKEIFAGTGGANIRILSNSWGGSAFSQALLDQINTANDHDMLFVAAAGNNGIPNDILPTYPASYDAPNIVAVAATTNTDARADFSNYGADTVHLGAPGVDILSTLRGNAYGFASGTSMATPHVSGAGALALSHCPLITSELKTTLVDSVDLIASMATTTISGGRLNVRRAIDSCSAPPSAPASLTAIGGDKQVKLSWPAATNATSYRVKRSTTPGGPYTLVASNIKTLQYVDSGLVNDITYYYVVSASNLRGESADSPESSATPKLPSDLIVSSLSAPGSAAAGSSIAVSATTKNQGTGTADPSTTVFFISKNTLVDAADVRLAETHAVPSLPPGAFASVSISLGIPSNLGAGIYYLIAKADGDDALFESLEGNNTSARMLTVGPDLIVSALTVPSVAAPGEAIIASYSVRNQGTSQAAASTLRFYWSANSSLDVSDVVLANADVPPIDATATASGQTTLTVPAGAATATYYVIAEADASKVVQESWETNNTAARTVRVGGDLVISTFDAPSAGGAGVQISLGDTTKNSGASEIGASVTHFYLSSDAALSASDTLLGTRSVNALAANEASVGLTPVTIPTGTAVGSYYLFAKADGGNLVTETQEGNNSAIRSFTVGPDLIVSITSTPWPMPAGSASLVKDNVTNRGGAEAGPSTVMYYLSTNYTIEAGDQLLAERSVGALGARMSSAASISVTVPAGTAPGYYYLIAKADAGGAVTESSETNNIWAQLIKVN
jgi:subtilisin family serine protease/subtilase family serine protease